MWVQATYVLPTGTVRSLWEVISITETQVISITDTISFWCASSKFYYEYSGVFCRLCLVRLFSRFGSERIDALTKKFGYFASKGGKFTRGISFEFYWLLMSNVWFDHCRTFRPIRELASHFKSMPVARWSTGWAHVSHGKRGISYWDVWCFGKYFWRPWLVELDNLVMYELKYFGDSSKTGLE